MQILTELLSATTITDVDRVYNFYLGKLSDNQKPRLQELTRRRKNQIDPNWEPMTNNSIYKYELTKPSTSKFLDWLKNSKT
jgi:hypothetical protein